MKILTLIILIFFKAIYSFSGSAIGIPTNALRCDGNLLDGKQKSQATFFINTEYVKFSFRERFCVIPIDGLAEQMELETGIVCTNPGEADKLIANFNSENGILQFFWGNDNNELFIKIKGDYRKIDVDLTLDNNLFFAQEMNCKF